MFFAIVIVIVIVILIAVLNCRKTLNGDYDYEQDYD